MSKEVATVSNDLPDYLRDHVKTDVKMGNIDQSDMIIPRVKLLQALSPEVSEYDNAKAGSFWHTAAGEPMGDELIGIPIIVKKTYVLWAPRNDDRGILARASDGVHWDTPGLEFTVKPKGSSHEITYRLGERVDERIDGQPALSEFGSSIPGDPQSVPAASLTYQWLWLFPDFLDYSPSIILNTRSSAKIAQRLINTLNIRPVEHYYCQVKIGVVQERSDDGPFYNYKYTSHGYAPKELAERAKELYEVFSASEWGANDESEMDSDKGYSGDGAPKTSAKF